MTCTEIYHQLDAFVDGELSPDETRGIEHHLEACPACRARVEQLRALTATVRRELRGERAPSDLWARIDTQLPIVAENSDVIRPTVSWWRDRVRPLALAASVASLIGVAGGAVWWQLNANYSVVAAPVQDFTTYQLSERALDVESSDPDVIRAWFEEKLAFELPSIKARIAGFDLVGGRLCWLLDRRISALAYQRGEQVVSVYVMADHDLSLPEAIFEPELSISRSVHEVDDVNNMIWQNDGLVYTVVSDLKAADLSIFLAALARGERQSAGLPIDSQKHQQNPMGAST